MELTYQQTTLEVSGYIPFAMELISKRRTELLTEISGKDFTGNQHNQVYRYIVKWCSLCFLAETEMDAIKKAFNQADTPSSTNFDTITLSKNTLIYS